MRSEENVEREGRVLIRYIRKNGTILHKVWWRRRDVQISRPALKADYPTNYNHSAVVGTPFPQYANDGFTKRYDEYYIDRMAWRQWQRGSLECLIKRGWDAKFR